MVGKVSTPLSNNIFSGASEGMMVSSALADVVASTFGNILSLTILSCESVEVILTSFDEGVFLFLTYVYTSAIEGGFGLSLSKVRLLLEIPDSASCVEGSVYGLLLVDE